MVVSSGSRSASSVSSSGMGRSSTPSSSSSSSRGTTQTAGQIIDAIRAGGGTVNTGTVAQYTGGG
jgi:hypothetical protein